ncbi:MAG: hypothetical protein KDD28_06950, partial [Phaeodactylibacter sp.]|nr:hypothetical protein [Phaeodactylibacter sp.]
AKGWKNNFPQRINSIRVNYVTTELWCKEDSFPGNEDIARIALRTCTKPTSNMNALTRITNAFLLLCLCVPLSAQRMLWAPDGNSFYEVAKGM